MSRDTDAFYAKHVNGAWPEIVPPLTDGEARTAALHLYRFAFKKKCPYPVAIVHGNRHSYIRRHGCLQAMPYHHDTGYRGRKLKLCVNPDSGWRELVHHLSHAFFSRLHPEERPHSHRHGPFEASMVRYVLDHGWLDGKLRKKEKPKPTKTDLQAKRLAQTVASIERWRSKERRAKKALAKLERRRKYYERAMAA